MQQLFLLEIEHLIFFCLMFVLVRQIFIVQWEDAHFMRDCGSIPHEDPTVTALFQYFVFMFNF